MSEVQTDQHALANIAESSYHLASANLTSLRGENPSAVLAKALTDPEKLTIEDRIVLDAHHKQILYEADLYRTMAQLGIYENMAWEGIVKSLSTNLAYPKGREWWAENRYWADPAIRDIFDESTKIPTSSWNAIFNSQAVSYRKLLSEDSAKSLVKADTKIRWLDALKRPIAAM